MFFSKPVKFFSKKTKVNSAPNRRRSLRMGEGLEMKSMMAADASISYDAANDVVRVIGSDYSDEIRISVDDKGTVLGIDDTLEVKVTYDKNPLLPGVTTKTFSQPLQAFVVSGNPPTFQWTNIVDRVVVEAGKGNDEVINNTDIPMTAEGGDGNDILLGGSSADRLYGDAGKDTIRGRQGVDLIYGGDDADQLFGNENNDWLYGGDGNDKLFGNDGEDYLNGGYGEDRLDGGQDGVTDRLEGGPGVYTDAFQEENHLVATGKFVFENQNREDFVDFNAFNDIDEGDNLFGPQPAKHTLPSEIGDVNASGRTDIVDFARLRANFNKAGERNDGDLNGDRRVNIQDFAILREHFNETADYDFLQLVVIPNLTDVVLNPNVVDGLFD